MKLFDQFGYHKTSIAMIAEESATTKANIYHYFRTKHEILFAIYDKWIDELTELFERNITDETPIDEAIRQIFIDLMSVIVANPGQVRVYFEFVRELPSEFQGKAQAKRDRYGMLIEDTIIRGIASGALPKQSAHIATQGLLGMCAWASQWYQPRESPGYKEIAAHFSKIYLEGVRAP